jgi:DNA repair exonuclease SbcCD ATPase subunit
MKLKSLEIEYFLSVKSAQLDLDDKGLVLITGENLDEDAFDSNGAGKSTIFSEAPTWALFGETIRGHKGDKVCNRESKANTRVALTIEDDNGDIYEIIRHRKHKQHKNHVLVLHNGENITAKSDTETNKMIIELLQMDFITFTNSIMFGQGLNKTFAISTDSEQKKVLEQMLQIDIFRACQERAKGLLSINEKKQTEVENSIRNMQDKIKTIEKSIEDLQAKEAELGEKVRERIESLELEIADVRGKMEQLETTDELEEHKKTLQGLVEKIDSKIEEYSDFIKHKGILEGEARSLKRDYDSTERKLNAEIKRQSDIKVGKNIPKKCSECGQDLPLKDTSHIEKHIEDNIAKLEKECEDILNQLTETRDLLNKVNDHLEGKKKYDDQKTLIQNNIRDVEEQIRAIVKDRKHYEQIIKRAQGQIEEQKELLGTTYTGVIEQHISQIDNIKKDIDTESAILDNLISEADKLGFWVNSFGNQGIKSVLLDSVTPFLNRRANYYLSKLSGSSIEVKFNTQQELKNGDKRDKFSVEVINEHGDDNYTGNSGGEKRRVDVAINMALQDLVASRSNKSMDIIVYDEVYEGLDEIGCQSVIELLQEKAETFGSVFVVTHNENLKQMFTKSVKVTKENGKTLLQYQQ